MEALVSLALTADNLVSVAMEVSETVRDPKDVYDLVSPEAVEVEKLETTV